jgi:predicted nucleotidyltransferase
MILEQIKTTLLEYGCEEAYLTGSRAKGLQRENSDIDLIVRLNRNMRLREMRKALKALNPKLFIDIHVDVAMNEITLKNLLKWAKRIM